MPPARFNSLLPECQDEYFADRLRNDDDAALRPFYKTIGDDTVPMVVTDGVATLPEDYAAKGSGYYMYGSEAVRINFVDNKEFERLLVHKNEYPTDKYPIANILASTVRVRPSTVNYIRFNYLSKPVTPVFDWCYPVDNPTQIVNMPVGAYLVEQSAGVYNLMYDNGTSSVVLAENVGKDDGTDGYVSTTTELQWDKDYHWKLIYILLSKVGVNLSEQQVAQYAIAMEGK